MNLRPINKQVILEPAAPVAKTDGGILVPEIAQRIPREGKVLAISPNIREPGFKPGDRVVLAAAAADLRRHEVDGKTLIITDVESVLGVVEGECGVIEGRKPGKVDSRGKHHLGGF